MVKSQNEKIAAVDVAEAVDGAAAPHVHERARHLAMRVDELARGIDVVAEALGWQHALVHYQKMMNFLMNLFGASSEKW